LDRTVFRGNAAFDGATSGVSGHGRQVLELPCELPFVCSLDDQPASGVVVRNNGVEVIES